MTRRFYVTLLLIAILPVIAPGQTFVGEWSGAYYTVGIDGTPVTAVEHGGQLVIGGRFSSAAHIQCRNIVRYSGNGWASYATDIPDDITAIAPHDGTLVALTASPRRLWRLGGSHWQLMSGVLGAGPDLLVSHNGDLYVGGAVWDGSGLTSFLNANGTVTSVTVFEGMLVFGGSFTACGDDTLGSLVAWDGAQVTRPWPDFGMPVRHLSAHEGQLIAIGATGGWQTGDLVFRYSGDDWSVLPFPDWVPEYPIARFTLWHEGQLYAFYREHGWDWHHNLFRRWTGTTWVDVAGTGNELAAAISTGSGIVLLGTDLAHQDTFCGTVARRPNGAGFGMLTPLVPYGFGFVGGGVRQINTSAFNGLIFGGDFRFRGALYTPKVTMELLGDIVSLPFEFANGGAVARAVGVEPFLRIHATICQDDVDCAHYVWDYPNGNGWQLHGQLGAMVAIATKPGSGSQPYGATETTVHRLADAATLGTCGGGVIKTLHAKRLTGTLVAGGTFTQMAGTTASKISWYNGTQWLAFPAPIGGSVTAMTDIFENMVIAGRRIDPDGPDVYQVAEWANDSWRLMGGAFNGEVRTLEYHGGYVFAGGDFTSVGGVPINRLAGWDGEAWRPVGSGCNGTVWSLLSQGSQLLIGGGFTRGGGKPAGGMTSWVFQEISTNVPHAEVPSSLVLHAPGPNPFNPMTTVSFDLPQSSRVDLSVFDLRGRRLATLIADDLTAGSHSATWRGTDQQGRAVASGVYLIRLQAGNEAATRRVSLIR